MDNYKGKLQEYYARIGGNPPRYTYEMDPSSTSNEPIWHVKVFTVDGYSFSTTGKGKRKNIEQEVARIALENLTHKPEPSIKISSNTVLLVDVENQGDIYKYANEIPDDVHIVIFGSKGGPVIECIKRKLPGAEIVEIPSTRKNAADIGLCIRLGKYLTNINFSKYVIVTNDNFAEIIIDCFERGYIDMPADIIIKWHRTITGMLREEFGKKE